MHVSELLHRWKLDTAFRESEGEGLSSLAFSTARLRICTTVLVAYPRTKTQHTVLTVALNIRTFTATMSEPIPEAIPTSADPRTRRPLKRMRGANTAIAAQANEVENLMWDPSIPVEIPPLASETKPTLEPPPEFVANVQGSSAGAGSGEFHVYKASRRREYERLRAMDEEAQQEEEQASWEREIAEKKKRDEERTAKNKARRDKRKKGKAVKDRDDTPDTDSGGVGLGTGTASESVVKKAQLILTGTADGASGKDEMHNLSNAVSEPGITIHDDD